MKTRITLPRDICFWCLGASAFTEQWRFVLLWAALGAYSVDMWIYSA